MENSDESSRRRFIQQAAVLGGGLILAGCAAGQHERADDDDEKKEKQGGAGGGAGGSAEEEVSPAEDLMREHGVLKRVLLVYGEAVRRIDAHEELPPEPVADAARIIRSFVEDYHEKNEEDFLFPRLRKANTMVDLVNVLYDQHQAGRRLTDATLNLATAQALRNPTDRQALADSLRQFIRMYNPHEAREDTVLFPAFRKVVSASEYDALGEDFEKKEHQLFGAEGFEKMVDRVAAIERALGIYDLAQFTPK